MATRIGTVEFICDQAGLGSRLTFRKMFGEYALYLDGRVVALVCDDQLFLKPTPEGQKYLGTVHEAPPYPGAKNSYLLTSEIDDPDRLSEVLRITARALPEPQKKASSRRAKSPPGTIKSQAPKRKTPTRKSPTRKSPKRKAPK